MTMLERSPFDVLLESSDDASPTTALQLMFATGEDGKPLWKEERLPPFGFRQSQGQVGFADRNPLRDLVFYQNDWSGGALGGVWSQQEPNRYMLSDGVDLRWANAGALGPAFTLEDFLVRNGDAEKNSTSIWTAGTGVTYTAGNGSQETGSYYHKLVTDGARASGAVLLSFSLANPTVYRGRVVTFYADLWRVSGAESGVRISIYDGVDTTNSSAVTSGTATEVSAEHTVNAAATELTIRVLSTALETSAHTYGADNIYAVPAGGAQFAGAAEMAGNIYGLFGRCVCQWDETNDVWNAVYVNTVAATSIVEYNGNVYVAFGNGDNAYIYGATTSWTVSNLVGDAKYAHFLTVSRQTLWKSRFDGAASAEHYFLASSTNPVNGGSWSTEYTIGSSDRKITGLYSFNETIFVGKEDGLYAYLRVYADGATADLFTNQTNEFSRDPDTSNFGVGQEHLGWLYLSTVKQSLFRTNASQVQNLSALLFSSRPISISGVPGQRIRAMTSDPAFLYMAVDGKTSGTSIVLSLLEDTTGLHLHMLKSLSITTAGGMFVSGSYAWVVGVDTSDRHSRALPYRFALPSVSSAMYLDTTPVHPTTSQQFWTVSWDGGLPSDNKGFISLDVWHDQLTANRTITVSFAKDGSTTFTSLGTLNSGSPGVGTLYFDTISDPETSAVGKSIQLRFALVTNSATQSPLLYAFALHSLLKPSRVRTWTIAFQIGDGVKLHNGQADPQGKVTKLTNLSTLETQTYPIRLTADLNGDGVNEFSDQAVQIVPDSLQRLPQEERQEGVEVWQLQLQEVTVS